MNYDKPPDIPGIARRVAARYHSDIPQDDLRQEAALAMLRAPPGTSPGNLKHIARRHLFRLTSKSAQLKKDQEDGKIPSVGPIEDDPVCPDSEPGEAMERDEREAALKEKLKSHLNVRDYRIIEASFFDGMSDQQIAEELKSSVASIKAERYWIIRDLKCSALTLLEKNG